MNILNNNSGDNNVNSMNTNERVEASNDFVNVFGDLDSDLEDDEPVPHIEARWSELSEKSASFVYDDSDEDDALHTFDDEEQPVPSIDTRII